MEIAKLYEDEFFKLEKHLYNTEKSICYTLDQLGLKIGEDFEFFKEIDNIPFTKSKKHKVDVVLTSRKDRTNKLYVEIKGQMTYLEVNKLRYLQDINSNNFYILQLTDLDWMSPYTGQSSKDAFEKSKEDFETQVQELVDFVYGNITANELSMRSKNRLDNYIEYRLTDLERWETIASQTNNNDAHN